GVPKSNFDIWREMANKIPGLQESTVKLSPGIDILGFDNKVHQVREVTVRPLNQAQQDLAELGKNATERRRVLLSSAVVRFGDLTQGNYDPMVFDDLLPVDIKRIEDKLKAMESSAGGLREIASAGVLSDPFPLRPGVVIDGLAGGLTAQTCQVRLLTRGDREAAMSLPENERDSELLVRRIARLGDCDDREMIRIAIRSLVFADELRIAKAVAELEASFTDVETTAREPEWTIEGRDIISEPFDLKVGIKVNGEPVRDCRVRLLTRGDWRSVESISQPETSERGYWVHIHSIASIGPIQRRTADISDIRDAYDQLAIVDTELIDREAGRLADSFREVENRSGSEALAS
ncbi:MAG: hypothetical protein ACREAC_06050, partial [Blastocatellia bacterium]